MRTLCYPFNPVNKSRVVNVGSYVKLTPVQQVQIVKYALTNGNKAAILRYTKEFQTEIKMNSISTWKAKYVSESKRLVKSSSGSRDVAVLS